MKKLSFLLSLCCWLLHAAYAQLPATVRGYYVTQADDTIDTQIKLPHFTLSKKLMLSKLAEKVEVVDSAGESRVFRVSDIKAFGFSYNENLFRFFAKDFGRENAFSASTHRFYQSIILGPASNLYHGSTKVDGSGRVLGATYFLQQSTGEHTAIYLFPQTKSAFIKTLLKRFYKDRGDLLPLIDGKFSGPIFETWENDIVEIVAAANGPMQMRP